MEWQLQTDGKVHRAKLELKCITPIMWSNQMQDVSKFMFHQNLRCLNMETEK